jgi:hypothetical protein
MHSHDPRKQAISGHLTPANLQGHAALTYARAPHYEADQSA